MSLVKGISELTKEKLRNKKCKNNINISFILIGILFVSFGLNYTSTAKYIQAFEPAVQSVTSESWEVESSIEQNGQSVHQQVISNFKPGDLKTNTIKFINKNNYDTTFFLEVIPIAYAEGNNLFLNPNIEFTLKTNNGDELEESEPILWEEIVDEQGNKIYKYKIDLLASETEEGQSVSYKMNIKWNHGENDLEYANKAGKISYKVIAEQTINSEEGVENSEE